jgi:hypothetical protein
LGAHFSNQAMRKQDIKFACMLVCFDSWIVFIVYMFFLSLALFCLNEKQFKTGCGESLVHESRWRDYVRHYLGVEHEANFDLALIFSFWTAAARLMKFRCPNCFSISKYCTCNWINILKCFWPLQLYTQTRFRILSCYC